MGTPTLTRLLAPWVGPRTLVHGGILPLVWEALFPT